MAFRRCCLEAIDGFDPQFKVAGDDVDICWQIQKHGWKIRFHPGAVVWHHRRNSIGGYWRQQVGYGKAEALLERKWPEKYNLAGQPTWAGRVYGNGSILGGRTRVYHGVWGTAAFQSLYERMPGTLAILPLIPEWYLVILALAAFTALGLLWAPLFAAAPLLVIAAGASFIQAIRSTVGRDELMRTTARWFPRWKQRTLAVFLHMLQPLARLWGRSRHGITPWRLRGAPGTRCLRPRTTTVWSENWSSPEERLRSIQRTLSDSALVLIHGGAFDRWEFEVRTGLLGAARLRMTVEEHGSGKQLVRFRHWPKMSRVSVVVLGIGAVLAAAGLSANWVITAILGSLIGLLAVRAFTECGVAMGALLHATAACAEKEEYVGAQEKSPCPGSGNGTIKTTADGQAVPSRPDPVSTPLARNELTGHGLNANAWLKPARGSGEPPTRSNTSP